MSNQNLLLNNDTNYRTLIIEYFHLFKKIIIIIIYYNSFAIDYNKDNK